MNHTILFFPDLMHIAHSHKQTVLHLPRLPPLQYLSESQRKRLPHPKTPIILGRPNNRRRLNPRPRHRWRHPRPKDTAQRQNKKNQKCTQGETIHHRCTRRSRVVFCQICRGVQGGNGRDEEEGSQCKEKGQGKDEGCCESLGLHSDSHGEGICMESALTCGVWESGSKLISFG